MFYERRTVLEYVTGSPPVPVVVVEGSGRAADLLAFAYKHGEYDKHSLSVLLPDGISEQLKAAIRRTFHVDMLQAEKLFAELLECIKKRDFITIFQPSQATNPPDSSAS